MKATRTCSVAGCERPFNSRELCLMHYKRMRKYGDPEVLVRQKGGPCAVEGCDAKYEARGFCRVHYRRWATHGDPHITRPCVVWVGDDAGYEAVHVRLKTARGSASSYVCPCGAPAAEWSYDHQDPDEKWDIRNGFDVPYSVDMARYSPMCRPCHRRFDEACKRLHINPTGS